MISLQILQSRHASPKPLAGLPRASRQRDAAQAVLDRIGLATILVAADRRILNLNRAADAVLRRGDALVARHSVLACAEAAGLPRLAAAIAAAAEWDKVGAVVLESPVGAPYHLSVAPLANGQEAGALILFADPCTDDASLAARLSGTFLLTATEAELATALAQGHSISEIAARRSVSSGTVRIQIKSVAAKMHCRRQAEIVAAVLRLPRLAADT